MLYVVFNEAIFHKWKSFDNIQGNEDVFRVCTVSSKPDQNSAHIFSPVFKVDKNSPLGLVRQQMPPSTVCGIRTPLKKKELSSDLEWHLIPVSSV